MSDKTTNGERKTARGDLAFFDFNFLSPGKKVKWDREIIIADCHGVSEVKF